MKSKFSFWIVAPVVVFLSSSVLLAIFILVILKKHESVQTIFIAILLFLGIWTWIVFGEFRKRAIKIYLESNYIEVVPFIGFGSKIRYEFGEFDGFFTISMPSRYGRYEYLFLIKNDSRIVTISQFYHKNYMELKTEIEQVTKNLGEREFKWSRELGEIF